MNEKLNSLKRQLNVIISDIRSEKKNISGFGAARSGTTFLQNNILSKHLLKP